MEVLVEVKIENGLPVNGAWVVPCLSAVVLLPVVHLFHNPKMEWELIEESVFRAYKNDEGEIKLQFPKVDDFSRLVFCVARIIDGMINAMLDTEWGLQFLARVEAKGGGIMTPSTQIRGPLKI